MEMFGPCCIWLCIFVLCQFGLASTFNLDFSLNQRRIGSGAGEVQNWRCLFYSLHSRMFSSFTLCALACFPLLTLSLYWFAHSNVLFLVFICLSVFFCKLLLQLTVLLQIVVIDHFPCFLFLQIIVSVPFSENFANRPTRSPSPSPMCKLVHNITTPCVLFAHCLTKASQPSYLIFERRYCPTLISYFSQLLRSKFLGIETRGK